MATHRIYKVEYLEEDVGRIRKQSKKWITWRFQVATPMAQKSLSTVPTENLLSDVPYTENRTQSPLSQENGDSKNFSISLLWSFKTGKQEVQVNGKTIWFGRKSSAPVFSYAWKDIENGIKFEILGTKKAPIHHVSPSGFRAFDLMIDGCVFDDLPTKGNVADAAPPVNTAVADLPKSIVEILFPHGYQWKDTGEATTTDLHESNIPSSHLDSHTQQENRLIYDEFKSHLQLKH